MRARCCPPRSRACAADPIDSRIGDPVGDDTIGSPDGYGWAPDITGVQFTMTADCTVSVGVHLGDQGSDVPDGDVMVWMDIDGDPSTGDMDGDEVILMQPQGSNERLVGVWNGYEYVISAAPGRPRLWGGVTAPAADLGISASADVRLIAATVGWQETWDTAPDLEQERMRVPVRFHDDSPTPTPTATPTPTPTLTPTLPLPPAPVPMPAPETAPAPVAPPSAPQAVKVCRVPKVEGMTVKRAVKKLRKAGCRFRTRKVTARRVRAGRVASTFPRAKRTTRGIVVLRVAR